MSNQNKPPANRTAINAFLQKVAETPVRTQAHGSGRLIFAMDATASRQPTWDRACDLQARMFEEADRLGGLQIQLCHYRGFREFHASGWCDSSRNLLAEMTAVRCLGGMTQIARVLKHALLEADRGAIAAVVLVVDAFEEDADPVCDIAGQLGIRGIPVFIFQEGNDTSAAQILRQLASLSGGAWAPFDHASATQLATLLSAVAVFAAGGRKALEDYSRKAGDVVLRLTNQLR